MPHFYLEVVDLSVVTKLLFMSSKEKGIFEMGSPIMARWFISFLFQKYGSMDEIRREYKWGIVLRAPADSEDQDHGVEIGDMRTYFVLGAKK